MVTQVLQASVFRNCRCADAAEYRRCECSPHDRGVRPVKVLLVEDELHVAASLKVGLRAEGFVVVHAETGTE
jgi:hypothetical protein